MNLKREQDIYFKKFVTFNYSKQRLKFKVSQSLFSSQDVDVGTKFLLRTLRESRDVQFHKVLDLGCGYGPIGLFLKSEDPGRIVHMTDRDALAVAYARENAELNGLTEVEIYGALGYDGVRRADFDLIVSNIPGKAGEAVIRSFLRDAALYLAPSGLVAVVVVSPLEKFVANTIAAMPNAELVLQRTRAGHAVFHVRFSCKGDAVASATGSQRTPDLDVYHRTAAVIRVGKLTFPMQTAYGMPEFDSLSYSTRLLVDELPNLPRTTGQHAVVFHPGQGHVPVALSKIVWPTSIHLVDRDLLALRCSEQNLVRNGYPGKRITLSHQVGVAPALDRRADLVAGVLREEEGQVAVSTTIDQAAHQLTSGGRIVVAGSSTTITRLAIALEAEPLLQIENRTRQKGYSSLVVRANS